MIYLDEEQAAATLRTAAHLVLGSLLPIETGSADCPDFAVAIADGVPASLELDALVAFGARVCPYRLARQGEDRP